MTWEHTAHCWLLHSCNAQSFCLHCLQESMLIFSIPAVNLTHGCNLLPSLAQYSVSREPTSTTEATVQPSSLSLFPRSTCLDFYPAFSTLGQCYSDKVQSKVAWKCCCNLMYMGTDGHIQNTSTKCHSCKAGLKFSCLLDNLSLCW